MKCWVLTVGEPVPLTDGPSPRLLRSALLAQALAARGHEVTWWTSSFDHYRKVHRSDGDACLRWGGVAIHLVRSVGYTRHISLRRIREHRGVARGFRSWARQEPVPDVVVASLPTVELADEGVRFAHEHGVPAIVDVHDLWPDLLLQAVPTPARPLGRLLLIRMFQAARRALRGADSLCAVSDGYLEWGLEKAGRGRGEGDAVFPLAYVRPGGNGAEAEVSETRLKELGVDAGKSNVLYVGSLGHQYDLDPVLTSARRLHAAGRDDIHFVIAGDGELASRWQGMASGLGNVHFTGWVQSPDVALLLGAAAVGLQPYTREAPQGLPNKLYDYLSAGVPVLSSLSGESERTLASYGCGVTYSAGDGDDFLAKLVGVIDEPHRLESMARRAREVFDLELEGAKVTERLADHVEGIAGRGQG